MASAIASRSPRSTRADGSNSTIPAMPHMKRLLPLDLLDRFRSRRTGEQSAHRRLRLEQRLAFESDASRLDRQQPEPAVALPPPAQPEELAATAHPIGRDLLLFGAGQHLVDVGTASDLDRKAAGGPRLRRTASR